MRGNFDCSGVDVPSLISIVSFKSLRKRYSIPDSVSILRPLPDDLPSRPRRGYAAVHEASLRGGLRLPFQPVIQELLVRLGVHALQMSPAFYRVVAACHMMLYRAKKRAVTADDIQDLMTIRGVPGKPGFYQALHRKRFVIVSNVNSKHRYPWIWVSESAFGVAPLFFGLAADFPPMGDIESSELHAVIRALPESRRQGPHFESPDLMARTGWFPPGDDALPSSGLAAEATEDPESEAGGSSAPPPDVGGTNRTQASS